MEVQYLNNTAKKVMYQIMNWLKGHWSI